MKKPGEYSLQVGANQSYSGPLPLSLFSTCPSDRYQVYVQAPSCPQVVSESLIGCSDFSAIRQEEHST